MATSESTMAGQLAGPAGADDHATPAPTVDGGGPAAEEVLDDLLAPARPAGAGRSGPSRSSSLPSRARAKRNSSSPIVVSVALGPGDLEQRLRRRR